MEPTCNQFVSGTRASPPYHQPTAPPSITPIAAEQRDAALATVTAAFAADPVERWLYPEDERYAHHFPKLVAAFGGPAFEQATAWGLDGTAAVALWLAPGVEADEEELGRVLTDGVEEAKHEEMFAVLEQMDAAHPTYPHWYLSWLAVEPGRQSEGLGGALLRHCLEIVDAAALPAFLETPNPRNIGFYERHGFAVIAATEAPSCPPLTSMLRPAAG